MGRRAGHDLEQPVGRHAVALALYDKRLERLGVNRVTRKPERLLSDEDLARRRGALETLRDHDHVTADHTTRHHAATDDATTDDAGTDDSAER